jgi:hypothetical protein
LVIPPPVCPHAHPWPFLALLGVTGADPMSCASWVLSHTDCQQGMASEKGRQSTGVCEADRYLLSRPHPYGDSNSCWTRQFTLGDPNFPSKLHHLSLQLMIFILCPPYFLSFYKCLLPVGFKKCIQEDLLILPNTNSIFFSVNSLVLQMQI